jgi:hypothetical protein
LPRRPNLYKHAIVMTTPDVARQKLTQHRTALIFWLVVLVVALAIAIPPLWTWIRVIAAVLALFSAYAVYRGIRHVRVWTRFFTRSGERP